MPSAAFTVGERARPPVFLTSFVGRSDAIPEVRSLLTRNRLVSLTGAGGSGKTRLALEVVRAGGEVFPAGGEVLPARGEAFPAGSEAFPDGVAWVELASLANPELLVQRVAGAVGLPGHAQLGASETFLKELSGRTLLLVLDGCEHLVDACAGLVEQLLVECPGVRILATTREALGVAGEHAWHVPPLSLPEPAPTSAEELLESEAARLFVERARAVRSDFGLHDENLAAIARICRTLDGIPLAIELAAARVRAFSAEMIAERLGHAIGLLTDGSRTAIPRHRTLRATIDWSYELLGPEERDFLPRLAVFRGGFSLSAAEEVCGGPDADAHRVFHLVARLVDRSLVEVRESRGAVRYHLLEAVRQYVAERLDEAGGAPELRSRHATHYHALVAEAEPFLTGPRRREWVARLARELDNIRGALAWSLDHDPSLHVVLTGSLCWFWFSTGHWAEGAAWLEGALPLAEEEELPAQRGRLLFGSGLLASLQGKGETARRRLEESATIARAAGDGRQEAYALNYLAMALIQDGDPRGEAPLEAALAWFLAHEETYGLRLALLLRATSALARGEAGVARTLGSEAVAVARRFGPDRELGIALQVLAEAELRSGDASRAKELLGESLGALRRDPLDLFIARGFEMLASVASAEGRAETAARLLGAAEAIRAGLDASPFGIDRGRLEVDETAVRGALGPDRFVALRSEGRRMPLTHAIDLAVDREPEAARAPDPPAASPSQPSGPVPVTIRSLVSEPAPALDVRALGPLEIFRDGVELGPDAWRLQKPRELLVYLLCHPQGRTREQIGSDFWPDTPAARVKNSFHVTLHHLRKALGGVDRVVVDGERYRIAPDLEARFDADRFERELGALLRATSRGGAPPTEDLERVLETYRGEFLEEEAAGEWHQEHRDRLRTHFIEGLLALAPLLTADGRHADCAGALGRAIRADNLREDAHRALMACHARMGRPDEALRHYDHLASFLQAELQSAPEAATRDLAERIRSRETT